MDHIRNFADRFRKPREEFIEETLRRMGISKKDPEYEDFKIKLTRLINRRSGEKKFDDFCKPYSSKMLDKVKKELKKRDDENETLRDDLSEAEELARLTSAQLTEKALSPNVFSITDSKSYRILTSLTEGSKKYNELKKKLKLENDDLRWRMDYLNQIGMVDVEYSGNDEICSLSTTGRNVISKRRNDFTKTIELSENKQLKLALESVGGDKMQAERLINWYEGKKGKEHGTKIIKLYNVLKDPKKVSQSFFGEMEGGNTQERHIGITIVDHKAAGEFLISKYS